VKDAKNCTASTASTTVADGTGPCTPSAFADAETGTGTSIKTASHGTLIKIQAYPNPATTVFTLQVKSSSNEKVTINVTNMFGKSAYTTTGSGNQQYSFGKNFLPGVYLVQVMQGKDVQTIKVIKQ
ncbi:MAG TPA: T9SS type A sorting domain-containing protein, partial [Panacibacter sp.]|nr:T9SS type A sorting domain-containing protein [Panacibacter sp.]